MKISRRITALLTSVLLMITIIPSGVFASAEESLESFDAFVDSPGEESAAADEGGNDAFIEDSDYFLTEAPSDSTES